MRMVVLLCLVAVPVLAETPMTGAEFESWSEGHTLEYRADGRLWGSEQHLPGRATLDADTDGPCTPGTWFPEGDRICFSYDSSPGPHCWRFLREGDQVMAEIVDDPTAPRYSVTRTLEPLACPGPDVGV